MILLDIAEGNNTIVGRKQISRVDIATVSNCRIDIEIVVKRRSVIGNKIVKQD